MDPCPVHGPEQRLALGQLEELPPSGSIPMMQRGQDPQGREAGAKIVPDVDPLLQRRTAGKAREKAN